MSEPTKHFERWAVVELFGHGKAIGFVTTEYFGVALPVSRRYSGVLEWEYVLEKPTWGGREP